jgi:farnesyl-diphosphate farnesyltransferase
MSGINDLHRNAMDMLAATSRTFYIPISRLPAGLQEAVASAYLCMRAIDEVEDHSLLSADSKVYLLRTISLILKGGSYNNSGLQTAFSPFQSLLPAVTLHLDDWIRLCPAPIVPAVIDATAEMAERMSDWVDNGWRIDTEDDLDEYTFCVAGAVGLLLSDLWMWHSGIINDRDKAIAFGRGLQAVNILRNQTEDSERGVDYFPFGWGMEEMVSYTRRNLAMADAYTAELPAGPILDFCRIPLALAHGTLAALAAGNNKLSRDAVMDIIKRVSAK